MADGPVVDFWLFGKLALLIAGLAWGFGRAAGWWTNRAARKRRSRRDAGQGWSNSLSGPSGGSGDAGEAKPSWGRQAREQVAYILGHRHGVYQFLPMIIMIAVLFLAVNGMLISLFFM